MSEVDDKEFEELLDLFRKNNLTKYGIDRLYGAIIDRKIKSRLEIERLNNIINELEKHLQQEINLYKRDGYDKSEIRAKELWLAGCYDEDREILDKLQELKGSDKE